MLIRKIFCFWLFFLVLFLIFQKSEVRADLGPKPTKDFSISFEGKFKESDLMDGRLYECADVFCTKMNEFLEYGPQGFGCRGSECHAQAYGFKDCYYKIIFTFADKKLESNVFTLKQSNLDITVKNDGLVVKGNTSINKPTDNNFWISFLITIVIEMVISLIFLLLSKKTLSILKWVFLSNLISLPIVWYLFPSINVPYKWQLGLSEIFAVLFESSFIYYFGKKYISYKRTLVLSLLNNVASVVGGLIILFWLSK
ncbi:MAG: hypothetical protein PHY93_14170 [Bacteriovorax sp.]|nr:hypothetical protein [Bacteriovorax sp.]